MSADQEELGGVAEAVRKAFNCRAVVLVVIDDDNVQAVVANLASMPLSDALTCAAGSIHMAQSQLKD